MADDVNEIEWRRHLISSLDNVAKRIDENTYEHTLMRAEIASVKQDITAIQAVDPDKKIDDYVNSSRGWRMIIVGQLAAFLILVGSFIWSSGALNERVDNIKVSHSMMIRDVDDLKVTSPEYREYRLKTRSSETRQTENEAYNG